MEFIESEMVIVISIIRAEKNSKHTNRPRVEVIISVFEEPGLLNSNEFLVFEEPSALKSVEFAVRTVVNSGHLFGNIDSSGTKAC